MQLVDHRVGLMPGRAVVAPVEGLTRVCKQAQGRLARIGPRTSRGRSVESWREINSLCVGIEQDLVLVEAVKSRLRPRSGHRVGVVASASEFRLWDPAVPDSSRLIAQKIEVVSKDGIDEVGFRI